MNFLVEYDSPLGTLTLAGDEEERLCGLWLAEQKYFAQGLAGELDPRPDKHRLARARRWLDRYFAGERPDPAGIPLALYGSDFRQAVWRLLLAIPYGEVTTYGELARRLGRPKAAQAVGGAVGHNPISLLIPCHRVVGADGSLTGYAGGLAAKSWLLAHEGIPFRDPGHIYLRLY